MGRMMARWIRLGVMEPQDFEPLCARLAEVQPKNAAPALLWAHSAVAYPFALVAPRKLAPGRVSRWVSWALASAIATYRQFGLAAYLEEDSIWLHGRRIAGSRAAAIGECAFVASSFLAEFPPAAVRMPSRDLEDAFRLRLEAQHGWQFDHSWPTFTEKRASLAAL
jgi:hypothetical protein